jgi:precorrin-6B methylase 2/uncharacterized protein YbaR (Trm112 family)
MSFDPKLLDSLLVCTKSKAKLVQDGSRLVSSDPACRLAYDIRDGIPIMLVDEAAELVPDEWRQVMQRHGRDAVSGAVLKLVLLAICLASTFTALADDKPAATRPKSKPAAKADDATKDKPGRYELRREHDPNGIGKFYMGREIAHVMGAPAATWLERPEREAEESLSKLIPALGLKPGMIVADIGAGSGVITLMMADKVGDDGKILAVDIQQEMLDRLAKRLKLKEIDNVELVKGTEKSPRLPAASVDLALMVDVYHEFEFPYEMMIEISKAMKPGGRVVFVEYRKEDPEVPIKLVHKMTQAQVKQEIQQPEFGLKWKETIGGLPWQHIIVFERVTVAADSSKSKPD